METLKKSVVCVLETVLKCSSVGIIRGEVEIRVIAVFVKHDIDVILKLGIIEPAVDYMRHTPVFCGDSARPRYFNVFIGVPPN